MLHSISWPSYLITLLIAALAYYLYIGIRFYPRESLDFLKNKLNLRTYLPAALSSTSHSEDIPPAPGPLTESQQMELDFADTTDTVFEQVEELIAKIKVAIQNASEDSPNKVPLVAILTQTLNEYAHLKGTHFQSAITELIQNECENLGFPPLGEDQVRRLWD